MQINIRLHPLGQQQQTGTDDEIAAAKQSYQIFVKQKKIHRYFPNYIGLFLEQKEKDSNTFSAINRVTRIETGKQSQN